MRVRTVAKVGLVAVVIAALVWALVAFLPRRLGDLSGFVADFVLANAIGPEDSELPPTAHAVPSSYGGIQHVGGQGEGLNCSLPAGVDPVAFPRNKRVEAPVSLRMRQACAAHDYCYRHGNATYGYTQADCDYILQEQAFRLCRQITKAKRVPACETDARKITLGVRVGGAGSFRRAGVPSDTGRYSTYFEFDRYPLRSIEYVVTRIADAPRAWMGERVLPKALYVFTVHRSGTRLRIVGLKRGDRPVCALIDLPADYRFLTTAPLVLRHQADASDWLVWSRRTSLENTGASFDGIAPASASRADWDAVFGKVVLRQAEGCDRDPFAAGAAETGKRSAFHNARVRVKDGREVDTQISDYHPPLAVQNSLLDGTRLHLFGLTTYGCARSDGSTCVGHLQIDPERNVALFESFHTVDPNCLGQQHARFHQTKRTGDCDRYRDFVGAPFVMPFDGVLGMAWLRRGASNGDGYMQSATLRWAPARAPAEDASDAGLTNLRTYELAGLGEQLEPVALTRTEGGQQALFGVGFDRTCKGKLRVSRIPLIDEADTKGRTQASTEIESHCHPDLVEDFLTRPFSTVDQSRLIFLRTQQDSAAYLTDKAGDAKIDEAKIDLEIVVMPTSSASAATSRTTLKGIFSIRVCPLASGAEFMLAAVACDATNRVRYGRAQAREHMPYQAVRAINRAPIVVASLEDGEPDIVVVHPLDVMQTVWLKGVKNADGSGWIFQKQERPASP